jgi:probable methyltransferase
LPITDLGPDRAQFLHDVLAGLDQRPKHLSPKYFYDARGSALFDAICEQPEYYPTRTEIGILRAHAADMAAALGERVMLVELGSGSSLKTPLLLDALHEPAAYVPVDISGEHLASTATDLDRAYPNLRVLPVCADFTVPFDLPAVTPEPARVAAFFPGSTIGNFEPVAAQALLRSVRRAVGDGGALLIGIDLAKPRAVLEAAYDDAAGVTARFNLNLLARINTELDGDFDPACFRHQARYDEGHGRVEMHLQSLCEQEVRIAGRRFRFDAGETIHTENSYKHRVDDFAELAAQAGFYLSSRWQDARGWFAVLMLEAA